MLSSLKRTTAAVGGLLALTIVITGCGSTAAKTATTTRAPGINFNGKPSSITLSSAFAGASVPTAYTCDAGDKSPPLSWGALPQGTQQLALFILAFKQAGHNTHVGVQWAMAGLSPSLHSLQTGEMPPGALLGRNSAGHTKYTICPAKGTSENFVFLLYALPGNIHIRRNFNAPKLLGEISPAKAESAFGGFLAVYSRA